MSILRTIEIDFDIHKLIEAERRGFDESPHKALRRLLGLPQVPEASQAPSPGRPWKGDGIVLDHGTPVRMNYNGRLHEGQIDDGKWLVEGIRYSSPSGAASGTAVTKKGKKTNLNGWTIWEVKRASDAEWICLNDLLPKPKLSLEDLDL